MPHNLRAAWDWAIPAEWPVHWPGELSGRVRDVVRRHLRLSGRGWARALFGLSSDYMTDTDEPRIRLVISGRVQGVGFRVWVTRRALELGLRGWVRNCRDGSVEVEAAGPASALMQLREQLQDGPPLAHVFGIREEPAHTDSLADRFEIR